MQKRWYQSKTVWSSITLISVTVASTFLGLPKDQVAALSTIVGALSIIFLRDAIEKAPQRSKSNPNVTLSAMAKDAQEDLERARRLRGNNGSIGILLLVGAAVLCGCESTPDKHKEPLRRFQRYVLEVGVRHEKVLAEAGYDKEAQSVKQRNALELLLIKKWSK